MQQATPVERLIAAIIDSAFFIAVSWIPFGLGFILALGYYLTKDALPFLEGQSIGKKVMKIRVVKNGMPITNDYEAAILRTLPLIIPIFSIVDALMVILDKDGLRFGDKWAKTRVIKEAV